MLSEVTWLVTWSDTWPKHPLSSRDQSPDQDTWYKSRYSWLSRIQEHPGCGVTEGDQMLGMIGIGFQGSSVGMMWMPEWGKDDRATWVIRTVIYTKARHPLFVLFDQIGCMDRVSGFPCVVTLRVSFPLDQELEPFVSPEVAMCLDWLHFVFFFSTNKVRCSVATTRLLQISIPLSNMLISHWILKLWPWKLRFIWTRCAATDRKSVV